MTRGRQLQRPYEFRYKPGEPGRAPGWHIPHQPRLDWQLWFAALRAPQVPNWFKNLCWQLLNGSPPVRALFAAGAFDQHPPIYLRARLYDYRFSTAVEHARDASWWQRELIGEYFPVTRLPEAATKPRTKVRIPPPTLAN